MGVPPATRTRTRTATTTNRIQFCGKHCYVCLLLPILFCLLTVWFCRCSCLCCFLKGEAPQPRPSRCPAHCSLLTLPNERRRKKRNRLDGFSHTQTLCDWIICSSCVKLSRDKKEIRNCNLSSHTACWLWTQLKLSEDSNWQPSDGVDTKDINRRMYLLMFHLSRTWAT